MNEEQIAQLVQLLVQAGAAQDENQAMQIIQMASQGDQQAQQVVQQVVQQAQGGTPSARLGAKLNYLKKLKKVCNEDQELAFFKVGGKVCKACVGKKMQKGGEATKMPKQQPNKKITVNKPAQPKLDPRTTKVLPGGKYPTYWTSNDRGIWEREHGPGDEGAAAAGPAPRPQKKKTEKKANGGMLANKGTAFGDGKRGANPRNTDKGGHRSHGNTRAASYMKKTNVPNKFTAFGDTGRKKPTNVGLVGHRATGQVGRLQSKYTTSDNVNKHTAFGAHINRSHRGSAACPSTKGWKSMKGAPKGHGGQMGWKRYANGGTLTEAFVNYFQDGGSLNGVPFTNKVIQ